MGDISEELDAGMPLWRHWPIVVLVVVLGVRVTVCELHRVIDRVPCAKEYHDTRKDQGNGNVVDDSRDGEASSSVLTRKLADDLVP